MLPSLPDLLHCVAECFVNFSEARFCIIIRRQVVVQAGITRPPIKREFVSIKTTGWEFPISCPARSWSIFSGVDRKMKSRFFCKHIKYKSESIDCVTLAGSLKHIIGSLDQDFFYMIWRHRNHECRIAEC